jgi:starch-binding outer membrane protein, SusD/RagB family
MVLSSAEIFECRFKFIILIITIILIMKSNNLFIYLSLLIALILSSCNEEILEKQPLDIISDAQVWNDPNLIDAYVVNLYSRANMNGMFRGFNWDTWPAISPAEETILSDEARGSYDWLGEQSHWNRGILDGSGDIPVLSYWPYNYIRSCNEFLKFIEIGNVTEEVKKQRSAEVRFLRAFAYFNMVKRYGGVPLITVPQNISEGEAIFVSRNKEQEIYDFIEEECNAIIPLLPEEYTSVEVGRITSIAALALKSRAMLYAASIAKYGTVQLNGVVGIPADKANSYWQKSYDASKEIINSNVVSLFNKYPTNKVQNYSRLFIEPHNSEIILSKNFVKLKIAHSFDGFNTPLSFTGFWGGLVNPSMELVNAYEMVDGSSGVIDWANVSGNPVEILKNKDPRFHASIFYQGAPWQGSTVELYKGIRVGSEVLSTNGQFYQGKSQVGRDAPGSFSGFSIRKLLDETLVKPVEQMSSQPWIEFRYGEILLNFAEAAFELNKPTEALNAVNQIRERAGIAALTEITMGKIRNERRVELAFENHRYWDIRRWRIASSVLNGQLHRVYPYYDFNSQNFYFVVGSLDGYNRAFNDRHYYLPLTNPRINNNPNLVENPGY